MHASSIYLEFGAPISLSMYSSIHAWPESFALYSGDSGEGERLFRREAERHSVVNPNSIPV
jgi:hypothetical protein